MSRLLDAHKEESDLKSELTLRPGTLKEYIGQEELKKNLHIFIEFIGRNFRLVIISHTDRNRKSDGLSVF